jgi:hypothetical protein
VPAFGALTHRKILIDGYEAALKARDTAAEKRSGHPKWDNVLRTVGGGGVNVTRFKSTPRSVCRRTTS